VATTAESEVSESEAESEAPPGRPVAGWVGTLVADSGASDDVLVHPGGFLVASDLVGDGTVAAPAGHTLQKVGFDGQVSVYADGLDRPIGNAVSDDGWVYAVEYGAGGRVVAVSPDGAVSSLADGLNWPSNLVLIDGALYVTTWGDDSVQRLDLATGSVEVFATGGALSGPVGIVEDPEGFLLVASFNHGLLVRVDATGASSAYVAIPESGDGATADLTWAWGGLYVTSFSGHGVYRVSDDGDVERFVGTGEAGTVDGDASVARFDTPNGVAASADGRTLYVQQVGGALRSIVIEEES
jgi:sugar lactone lactonase YvrE